VNYLKNLWYNEKGADLAEYALVLVLISIVAITAMTALGGQVSGVFDTVAGTLAGT
jgi:pilus assembly protein Flp/PilA